MTFAVNHMRSIHNLLTFLVAFVVTAMNIAILHVLFAIMVKHHNNTTTTFARYEFNNGFSYFFGVHSHWNPNMSDCGLHIWGLLHFKIPHL